MRRAVPFGVLLTVVGFGLSSCSELSQPTDESPSLGLAKGTEQVTVCHNGVTITVGAPVKSRVVCKSV